MGQQLRYWQEAKVDTMVDARIDERHGLYDKEGAAYDCRER